MGFWIVWGIAMFVLVSPLIAFAVSRLFGLNDEPEPPPSKEALDLYHQTRNDQRRLM